MAKNRTKVLTKQIKVHIRLPIASCCCTDPARKIYFSLINTAGDTIVSTHMIDGGTEGFTGSVM